LKPARMFPWISSASKRTSCSADVSSALIVPHFSFVGENYLLEKTNAFAEALAG
jgi:hypothetical protein